MNTAVSSVYISLNKSFQKEEGGLLGSQSPTGKREDDITYGGRGRDKWGCRKSWCLGLHGAAAGGMPPTVAQERSAPLEEELRETVEGKSQNERWLSFLENPH